MAARIGWAKPVTQPGRDVELAVGLGVGGNVAVGVRLAVGEALGGGVSVTGIDGKVGVACSTKGLHADARTKRLARINC
jgi:hypothetical protein